LAVLDHRRRANPKSVVIERRRRRTREVSAKSFRAEYDPGPTALDGIHHSLKGMRPTVLEDNRASFDAELEASGVLDAASHPDFGFVDGCPCGA
jgi:hypothetical protein